jgi:hypothetical protein
VVGSPNRAGAEWLIANGKAYGDTHSVERRWSSGGRSSNEQPTGKPVIAAKIGSKRRSKLQCNFNHIRVRSFILTGAPVNQ